MIVTGSRNHGHVIAKAAGCIYYPDIDPVISRVDPASDGGLGGRLRGGVIFKSYTGASLNMHIAGFDKNWMNRDFLWAIFDYPFVQLGCSKVFATIHSGDEKLLDFVTKIGFSVETTVRDVFRNTQAGNSQDMIILGMYRDQCRWLSRSMLRRRAA